MLLYGEDGLSGQQGMNHHVNPGEWHKHIKHGLDSHFHTMSYVGTHRPEKTKKCVLGHICVFWKKEYNTRHTNLTWNVSHNVFDNIAFILTYSTLFCRLIRSPLCVFCMILHLLRVGWMNICPVVLLCQFFGCGGNSLRWYLPTIPVVPLCLFLLLRQEIVFGCTGWFFGCGRKKF